jgi:hypothetical protein
LPLFQTPTPTLAGELTIGEPKNFRQWIYGDVNDETEGKYLTGIGNAMILGFYRASHSFRRSRPGSAARIDHSFPLYANVQRSSIKLVHSKEKDVGITRGSEAILTG